MEAGSRVEIDQRKRHPMDFALWKSAKPGEPHWPSPWGNGRPGWHIECSVMSTLFLGPNFDIHGGGRDLIFPHHENERAQALAHRTDSKFACCWLHNGFVNIGGEKMAKSLGNFFTIEELLRRFTGETLRYYLLNTQYRNPINFELQIATCLKEQETMTPEKLRAATQFPGLEEAARRVHYYYDTLNRIDETLRDKNLESTDTNETFEQITNAQNLFWQAIADDFNTPAAIGSYSGLLRTANDLIVQASEPKALRTLSHIRETLLKLGQMLGLMELEPQTYLASERDCCLQYIGVACAEIEKLIAERKAARAARDWKRADEIRESLRKQGIIICDNPQGTTWTVSN
jgi:cysteinyl-tRNA synthetase